MREEGFVVEVNPRGKVVIQFFFLLIIQLQLDRGCFRSQYQVGEFLLSRVFIATDGLFK